MKKNQLVILCLMIVLQGCKNETPDRRQKNDDAETIVRPKVSFTFDDGITSDLASFKFEEWNDMILSALIGAIQKRSCRVYIRYVEIAMFGRVLSDC